MVSQQGASAGAAEARRAGAGGAPAPRDEAVAAPAATPAPTPAPAIADYAIIGDCRAAALVARDGSIDWLCLPNLAGPAVFAAILDPERGGRFALRPEGAFAARRRYVEDSAVLETRFETADGVAAVTDFMPVAASAAGLRPMREVLRLVEGVEGRVRFEAAVAPRPDYARATPRLRRRGALGWAWCWGDEALFLAAEPALEAAPGGALGGRFAVAAGERRRFSLSYAKAEIGVLVPLAGAEARLAETLAWWRGWSGSCRYAGPHGAMVRRSAITLKLLTYCLSGAVVAAPTASLPEAIGGERNWDYRYCWLRDAALAMRAFTGLGYRDEAKAFLDWLLHATRLTWPELRVVYDLYGRTNLTERELAHLSGHRGSRPVRIGNGAYRQRQLDVYGSVVLAACDFVETGGRLDPMQRRLLAGLAKPVRRQWREPDSGIWETRGPPRQFTLSKAMCWGALDGLLALAARGEIRIDAEALRQERDAIAAVIEARGFNPRIASYVAELDGERVDAGLLLLAILGYRDAGEARMRATFDRIAERLGDNGLLYRHERADDEFAAPEGAFGICSFWAVEHLARRGEHEAAEAALAHLIGFSNDVGLYGEEIDPASGAALGNFPQAFTHVGLINAALALERAKPAGPAEGAR